MKYTGYILIFLVLLGCNKSTRPEKPENLIPKDDMANVLYDVFILNAAKGAAKSVLEDHGIFPEEYVFDKYNIDSLQFALSNAYYSYDIKTYEAIVSKVEERINTEKEFYQSEIEKDVERQKRERDSLNKLSDSLNMPKVKTLIVPDEKAEDQK